MRSFEHLSRSHGVSVGAWCSLTSDITYTSREHERNALRIRKFYSFRLFHSTLRLERVLSVSAITRLILQHRPLLKHWTRRGSKRWLVLGQSRQ